jgi:hypothetical protein
MRKNPTPLYGLMAEFDNPTQLVEAGKRAYEEGYRKMDGYSPFPIEEMADAIGYHRTWMPPLVLAGGIIGCLSGFLLQAYIAVIDYPLNVGGRPLLSWPSFIPVTFEMTVLVASLTAVVGLIALNGLPQPYHPVFNVPRFELASRDRFFLVIEARDPRFNYAKTKAFLESLEPREVSDVES